MSSTRPGGELDRLLARVVEALAGTVAQAHDDAVPARRHRQAVIHRGVAVALAAPPAALRAAARTLAVELQLDQQRRALARAIERGAHVRARAWPAPRRCARGTAPCAARRG